MRCWMTCFAVCAAIRPKLSGRHVRALDLIGRDLRPVELEVVVRDQRVLALAGLLLELLELGDARLARLLDEPVLDVLGDLDPEDAELAVAVELHLGVARGARCLLVRGARARPRGR